MKRIDMYALAGIFGSSIILASFLVFATAYHTPTTTTVAAAAVPAPAAAPPVHMSWVVATPDMLKSDVGPAYVPGNPTLPADASVTVTVTNFDDATALTAGTERYAVATGVVGALTVESIDPASPNAPGTTKSVLALDPYKGVSHTFTIPSLGLNVPIAPKSRTTFTFHTGKAGTYQWQCFDPCGSDPNGWGGAMATAGYMKGSLMTCGSCAGASGCC